MMVDKSSNLKDCCAVTQQPQKAATRKPGAAPLSQTEAARALRCSREHLNRVLQGKLKSRRLLGLYHELITRQKPGLIHHEKIAGIIDEDRRP
jgi:hypothetical protein